MTMLTRYQWRCVLDQAVSAGLLSTVDPERLMPYLREGGLTADEEHFAMSGSTPALKMSKLEEFLRTRPSLEPALRMGLRQLYQPVLASLERAIDEQRYTTPPQYDPERFRSALRQVATDMEVLANWAVPRLLEAGCISRTDRDRIAGGLDRLTDVLVGKSAQEWSRLMTFLSDKHSDMHCFLRRAVDPSDPTRQIYEAQFKSTAVQACFHTADAAVQMLAVRVVASVGTMERRADKGIQAQIPNIVTAMEMEHLLAQQRMRRQKPPHVKKLPRRFDAAVQVGCDRKYACVGPTDRVRSDSACQTLTRHVMPQQQQGLLEAIEQLLSPRIGKPRGSALLSQRTSMDVDIPTTMMDTTDPGSMRSPSKMDDGKTGERGGATSHMSYPFARAPNLSKERLLERMDIRVVVPGFRTILCSARPQDSVGSVIDHLRRGGQVLGVSDVRRGSGGSLTLFPDWRQRTLAESGIEPGSTLTVCPVRPRAVRVTVFDPSRQVSVLNKTVEFLEEELMDWDAVMNKFRLMTDNAVGSVLMTYQARTYYLREGCHREAVWSYSPAEKRYPFLDEEDGLEDSVGERTHILLEFFSSGAGLHSSPADMPALGVYPDGEVLNVGRNGQLLPCSRDQLLLPTAVLLIRGLRLRDACGATAAFMLWLRGTEFADSDTGEEYADKEAATQARNCDDSEGKGIWSYAYVLLRHNDRLPRYKFPQGKTVEFYTRLGMEVKLHEGRIRGRWVSAGEVGSVWITTWKPSEFDEMLTEHMRK